MRCAIPSWPASSRPVIAVPIGGRPALSPAWEDHPVLGARLKYRYDHYTWPEMKEVIARQPVCLLPIGSVEDHGRHLPLDVDNFLIGSICEEVARRIPDEVILLPAIPFGFEDHHMSFPGTITVKPEHLEAFVLDVTLSLAHHGFIRSSSPTVTAQHADPRPGRPQDDHPIGRPLRRLPLAGAHRRALAEDPRERVPRRDVARLRARDFGLPPSERGKRSRWITPRRRSGFTSRSTPGTTWPAVRPSAWSNGGRGSRSGDDRGSDLGYAGRRELSVEEVVAAVIEFVREFRAFEIRPKLDLH